MTSNFNKKKINFLPSLKLKRYLASFFLLFFISFFIYNEFTKNQRLYDLVENISKKFNYQFINYELSSLYRVEEIQVLKIINVYLDQSIFLIPLKEISNSLLDLNWVKKVNLSTNLKNTIKIEIIEHKPIGLFIYNQQLFYFSEEGKIIDIYKKNTDEGLITFHGTQVLKEANNLLIILDKVIDKHSIYINEAYYINERRWDIKLNNNIMINLSEKNIEESINNYIKLIKNFNKSEIELIKNIDLRNNEKAIISF